MPDTPEAQQLLSPEILAPSAAFLNGFPDYTPDATAERVLAIATMHEKYFSPWYDSREYEALDDFAKAVPDLLSHIAAFRQQVVAELGRMLDKASPNSASGRAQIQDIESVAARLQIDLSPAPSA